MGCSDRRQLSGAHEAVYGGGGGGCNNCRVSGGGGGGGAVGVVASRITIQGNILANGGNGGGRGGGGSIWLRASEVSVMGSLSVSGGNPGRIRIDAHKISDSAIDSRSRGTTSDLPPDRHLYQDIQGTIYFDNNSLSSVSASLRIIE